MAETASENILALAWKYNGDWNQIYADVKAHTMFDFSSTPVSDIIAKKHGAKHTTLIDKDFPEWIRNCGRVGKVPWCLLYKGDLALLSDNSAITVMSAKCSVNNAINKYSVYALVKVLKEACAENRSIVLNVDSAYHSIAMKTIKKHARQDSKVIEFLEEPIDEYELRVPASERADLYVSIRWDNSAVDPTESYPGMIAVMSKSAYIVEYPEKAPFRVGVSLTHLIEENKDIIVVPYPFFDSFHKNNNIIQSGGNCWVPVPEGGVDDE